MFGIKKFILYSENLEYYIIRFLDYATQYNLSYAHVMPMRIISVQLCL